MTEQTDAEKAAEDHFAIVRDRNLGEGARYKVKWSGLYDGQEIREAFLAGAAWAAPKWIKCSERLPEALETVLVMLSGIAIPCYGYRLGYGISYWAVCDDAGELDNYLDNKVSHWMPLPKAPEEEK